MAEDNRIGVGSGDSALGGEEVARLSGATTDEPIYGGQALIEGVLMRGPRYAALVVRRPDGSLEVRREEVVSLVRRVPRLNKPLVRGVIALWETLILGLRALQFSAHVATQVDNRPAPEVPPRRGSPPEGTSDEPRVDDAPDPKPAASPPPSTRRVRAEGGSSPPPSASTASDPEVQAPGESGEASQLGALSSSMFLSLGFSVVVALALFVVLPNLLAGLIGTGRLSPEVWGRGADLTAQHTIGLNLLEGIIRLLLVVAYVLAIALIPDIRRVFQYHGAEHKVVNAVEARRPLSVENAREFSVIHLRCGTNFLVIVILVSILVFSLFGWGAVWERVLVRLALLPVVVGVSYEVLKWMGRRASNRFIRTLISPGLLAQRLTTRVPSEDQIEVALRAMEEVVSLEGSTRSTAGAPPAGAQPRAGSG